MAISGIVFKDGVLTVSTENLEKLTRKEIFAARCRPRDIVHIDLSKAKGLKVIDKMTFYRSEQLEKVVLSEGLEVIERSAFYSCPMLSKVVFPSTLKIIGSSAFMNCESLKDITLPEGLRHIESNAFRGCSRLEQVIVPSENTIVERSAFSDCLCSTVLDKKISNIEVADKQVDAGLPITIKEGVLMSSDKDLKVLDQDLLKKLGDNRLKIEKVDLSLC